MARSRAFDFDYAVRSNQLSSCQDATETFRRTSQQLWHGSMDTSHGWTPAPGGGFRPNARAFAVDHERVIPSGTVHTQTSQSSNRAELCSLPHPKYAMHKVSFFGLLLCLLQRSSFEQLLICVPARL